MRTLLICCGLLIGSAGCSNSGVTASPDLATVPADMAAAAPDLQPSCPTNPMTHVEIINACTTANSVDKMPTYPTLAPNGQLPPLP